MYEEVRERGAPKRARDQLILAVTHRAARGERDHKSARGNYLLTWRIFSKVYFGTRTHTCNTLRDTPDQNNREHPRARYPALFLVACISG